MTFLLKVQSLDHIIITPPSPNLHGAGQQPHTVRRLLICMAVIPLFNEDAPQSDDQNSSAVPPYPCADCFHFKLTPPMNNIRHIHSTLNVHVPVHQCNNTLQDITDNMTAPCRTDHQNRISLRIKNKSSAPWKNADVFPLPLLLATRLPSLSYGLKKNPSAGYSVKIRSPSTANQTHVQSNLSSPSNICHTESAIDIWVVPAA